MRLEVNDLFDTPMSLPQYLLTVERAYVYEALKRNNWNHAAAARELRVSYRAMRHMIQKFREWAEHEWPEGYKKGKKRARKAWSKVRMQALLRDGGRCQACGKTVQDGVKMTVDHIKPREQYPWLAYEVDNLQVLCADCNRGKGQQAYSFRVTLE